MVHSNAAACYDLLRSMLTTTLSHSNVWYIKVIYRDYILKDFGFIFDHGYFFGSKSSNPITKADQANPIQPIHFLQLTKFNSQSRIWPDKFEIPFFHFQILKRFICKGIHRLYTCKNMFAELVENIFDKSIVKHC